MVYPLTIPPDRRNCSLESVYKTETIQLYERFRERKYPHRTLRRSKRKASQRSRAELLKAKEVDNQPQNNHQELVRIITPYRAQWEAVRKVLNKH